MFSEAPLVVPVVLLASCLVAKYCFFPPARFRHSYMPEFSRLESLLLSPRQSVVLFPVTNLNHARERASRPLIPGA
jgi:hypothetical protein